MYQRIKALEVGDELTIDLIAEPGGDVVKTISVTVVEHDTHSAHLSEDGDEPEDVDYKLSGDVTQEELGLVTSTPGREQYAVESMTHTGDDDAEPADADWAKPSATAKADDVSAVTTLVTDGGEDVRGRDYSTAPLLTHYDNGDDGESPRGRTLIATNDGLVEVESGPTGEWDESVADCYHCNTCGEMYRDPDRANDHALDKHAETADVGAFEYSHPEDSNE